jgi:predicted nucleic acid-binding protein
MSGIDLKALNGARLYIDTNVFIYFVEGHPLHLQALDQLFGMIDAGDVQAHTSDLALAELLVRPFREQRADVVAVYDELLGPGSNLRLWPVTRDILRRSAQVRGSVGNRLPDAIHLATAMAARADFFLTADARLRVPEGVRIVLLDELRI